MRTNLFLALVGLALLAGIAIPTAHAVDWFVPQDAIVGTLANAKFITIGKKFEGDFCNGGRVGKMQGLVAVYTGSDPAALTQFIKDATGVNPGTRLGTITKAGLKDCTDTLVGDIFKYTGTED